MHTQFVPPTSGPLKCRATCVQISLTAGYYRTPTLRPQRISESLETNWQAPPVNTFGGKTSVIASLDIFSIYGGGWLSDDKRLASRSLCHGLTCQWSKHDVVYSYCGAARSFNKNFVLEVFLSTLEYIILYYSSCSLLTAKTSSLPPLNTDFEQYWHRYIEAYTRLWRIRIKYFSVKMVWLQICLTTNLQRQLPCFIQPWCEDWYFQITKKQSKLNLKRM